MEASDHAVLHVCNPEIIKLIGQENRPVPVQRPPERERDTTAEEVGEGQRYTIAQAEPVVSRTNSGTYISPDYPTRN